MTEPVEVDAAALEAFGRALLVAAGATPGHARTVVGHLLEAERMGLRSHGIMRIPQYLHDIEAGEIVPDAEPQVMRTAPGCAHVDGGRGFGMVVGHAMAEEAVRLATANGVGFVTGRHMGHTGRIGAYPAAVARAGCLGIAVCSGPPSGHWVAPFGGLEGRLSTNPIAYAWPVAGAEPVVADFSTSVVPEGVIRSLKNRGLQAPPGALRDARGRPSTDPDALYGPPRGAIQAMGGDAGYRGTALGLLVEALAALLSGDDVNDQGREGSDLAMIAIRVDAGFAGRAATLSSHLTSSPPLDPSRPVLMPGDRELRHAAEACSGTVLVDAPSWAALVARAGPRVPVPPVLTER
ncbi:MAG: Ldh family oxidoreductase [Alsobacter sp.]